MNPRISITMAIAIGMFAPLGCGDSTDTPDGGGDGATSNRGGGGAGDGAGLVGGSGGASASGGGGAGEGGTIHVDPPTCVDAATLPAWRQGMAIGEWKHLPSADLGAVTPDVPPSGYYAARIDAWNGFGADITTSRLYLAGAGGHADYAGNEVYSLDLNAAAPQWVIEIQPSPASVYTIDQPYYSDGRPSSTHTYYSVWYVEQRAKVFRFPTGATWGSGNGSTPHIDSWDTSTKLWDPPGTNPDLGPNPIYEAPTAKDVLSGDVYQAQGDNHLYVWRAESGAMEDLGAMQGGTDSFYDLYKSPSVIDPANRRILFFSDGAHPGMARVRDLMSGEWSSAPVGGVSAAAVTASESQAMVFYDVCAESFVMKTSQAGALYFIDPTTLEASELETSGDLPPDAINGVHTLFQYVPKLGGYAYQPKHDAGLYFLATQ